MKNHSGLRLAVSLALALSASGAAVGQDAAKLFAKSAEYQGATLSPTGAYVAVTTPFEERRALTIIKLSGKYERSEIKFDVKEQPFNPIWTDDARIMVEKAKDYGYLGSLSGTGDIYAADADAGNQVQLFGYHLDRGNVRSRYKDDGYAYFSRVLPNTKGEAIFEYVPYTVGNSKFTTSVFRVDTYSGLRKQMASFPELVDTASDNLGNLRFVLKRELDGTQVVRYRRQPTDKELTELPRNLAGIRFEPWWFEPDNNHAYVEISDKGEPASAYRIDLAAGTRERIAGNPTMDIAWSLPAGREGNPFVVGYDSGRPKIDYIDPKSEWSQLHSALMKLFPGQLVTFHGITRDNNKVLFFVYSDRHPGTYYIFDRTTRAPQMLFETMEWIDPAKMSPTLPIEFKNRGGNTLYGFYTAPLGKKGALPMVVLPHGGPFKVHDSWGYDADVQFLASLGYAVLQVNYRGSSGRGDDFETAAYRQWGTGIQEDIADGVKHVIAQGMADPTKVCIYGASFGAYSAMMNPIRNPGMYKCAIGYAGVYDLAKLYATRDGSKQGRSFYGRTMGDDPTLLREQSPITHIASFNVPMLLIHGKADNNTSIEQYDAAVAALSHAGKTYESLVKPNEGHGFYKEENRVEAYERMRTFLLKYNPPN